MEASEFRRSAAFMAQRNVSPRVAKVLAAFGSGTGHLRLTYLTYNEPVDEDNDDCELMCAELIAEFPDIRTAETHCANIAEWHARDSGETVFSRDENL